MRLGEVLVKEGILTRQQLNVALERQVTFGGRIGTNLIELRILTEEEFTNFLSKFYKVPAATPEKLASISEDALHALSQELMEKYKVLPLKKEGRRLQVAVLNPNDEKIDELGFITNFTIIPRVISELRLLYELERYYGIKSDRRFIRFLDRFNPTTEVTDSIEKMKSALRDARNSEEIVELLLRAVYTVATRVAIFTIHGERVLLWKAKGIEVESFEMVREESSIFSEATKSGERFVPAYRDPKVARMNYYRGPLRDTQGNASLIRMLAGKPQDVLVTPLTIGENIVAFLYADNGNDSVLDAHVAYLAKLASMGSLALEILTLKERLLEA